VNGLLAAALEYAQRGWRVVPLQSPAKGGCSCGRADCASPAKHPRTSRGLKDGACDAQTIREWWKHWPAANIGITTGPESGIVILDVDGEPGLKSLREFEQRGWRVPDTPIVGTGKGSHIYFAWPAGRHIQNSVAKIGAGLDIRGEGGYVVAPPSMHISGTRYQWRDSGQELAACPEWLLSLTLGPKAAERPAQSAEQAIGKGGRTDHLTSLAGSMNRRGMAPPAIEAALLAENAAKCEPPLPEAKVRRIAHDLPARYDSDRLKPDILRAAIETITVPCSHRERFRALCVALQRFRGNDPVVLPLERIAAEFGCHWTLIARLRRQAVAEGWLRPERPAIAHRQAGRFHVLSDTAMSHENEDVVPHSHSHSHSSDTGVSPLVRRLSDTEASPLVIPPSDTNRLDRVFPLEFDPCDLAGSLRRVQ